MKKIIFFIYISLIWINTVFARSAIDVSVSEAARLIKNNEVTIVDVRTPAEFNEGHIKNAKNIDFYGVKFEQQTQNLPKTSKILLYCKSGRRSAAAAEQLKKEGFDDLMNLKGGISAWEKANEPIER